MNCGHLKLVRERSGSEKMSEVNVVNYLRYERTEGLGAKPCRDSTGFLWFGGGKFLGKTTCFSVLERERNFSVFIVLRFVLIKCSF